MMNRKQQRAMYGKKHTYLFLTTGGFSIEGKGITPKEARINAIKKAKEHRFANQIGSVTKRYNTYNKNGMVPTGYFPKTVD